MPKLTKKMIENLELPNNGQVFIWDDETVGFGIRLTKNTKAFVIQSRVNGKLRRLTIGRFGVFTLHEGRKEAKKQLQEMATGTDPAMVKKQQRLKSVTLGAAAEIYKKEKRTKGRLPLKDLTKRDIDRHMGRTFSDWKDMPIIEITREMVKTRYQKAAKKSIAQANQAFRILRAIYNFTAEEQADIVEFPDNPVKALKNHWGYVPAKNARIPADKVGHAYNYLTGLQEWATTPGRTAADLALFLLYTGCRFNEAASLPWDHVDLEKATWTIPDPKAIRKPITFPLSSHAVEILKARPRVNEFVFYGSGKTGHVTDVRGTMKKLSVEIGEQITCHDLRRTFLLITEKQNADVDFITAKLLMGHKLENTDITIRYKDTSDLTRFKDEVEKIAAWIERQGKLTAAENVVDIDSKRKLA
jgi:integrase